MRKINSRFITRFLSEAGLEGQNSTYYGFVEMDQYYCIAVAEGYDEEGGRESAKLAVDAAMEAFIQKPGMSGTRIRACLNKAHKSLVEQSVRIRLKAGILLVVSDYTRFRYGVCGNVMLYAFRNAGIYHQSMTHTIYQSMMDEGQKPGDGAVPAGETRNLYHYLGGNNGITVSGKIKLEDGDLLLMVTESFWSRINKVEILDAYESIQSEEDFLGDLQELYLRGSTDAVPCCCLVAVNVKKVYKENRALKKKIIIWSLVIVLILAVAGLILTFYIRNRRQKERETWNTVAVYEDQGDRHMADFNCLLAKQEYEKAAEAGKKLSKNEERLKKEQLLSDKINISTILEQADRAYNTQDYALARTQYKKVLELVKEHEELLSLTDFINRKLRLVSTGMEINTYMQSAALKEAAGDFEAADLLYTRAEAMLRIVDDPDRLLQAQLGLIRVREQADEEARIERAGARDQVIIDADNMAAMDAVLSGDFQLAVELYTKIRDAYIALENNEKAEETTQLIISLQKEAKAAGELESEAIKGNKEEAQAALLDGDIETAIEFYSKVRAGYKEIEDEENVKEIEIIITSLQGMLATEEEPEETQAVGPEETRAVGPGEAGAVNGPGEAGAVNDPGEAGAANGPGEAGAAKGPGEKPGQ